MADPRNWTWDDWFDDQYPLCVNLDLAVSRLSAGKDDLFRAALWSAVIEHAGESLRMYITPEPSAVSKGDGDGNA
jgi:hypothetical protein